MDIATSRPEGTAHLHYLMTRVSGTRDRTAFAELFELMAPKVKAYLARMTGDPAMAEDVTQETMLTVWRRADSFDPSRATMTTWVFTIARNRCIDRLRQTSAPHFDMHDPMLQPEAPENGEEAIERTQQQHRLLVALKTLPTEQADLIHMAYYQGKAHSDIATERSLPLGTVKSRLRLAMSRLRRAFDEV
jgi:RNA polymerase sigma-70 factor (ECF subfamily)